MGSKKLKLSAKADLPFKTENRQRRQLLHVKRKRALDSTRRDTRLRRRREEDKNPALREERLRKNVPQTLDRKRVWDEYSGVEEALGAAIDVNQLKRRKVKQQEPVGTIEPDVNAKNQKQEDDDGDDEEGDGDIDDLDSMLASSDSESVSPTPLNGDTRRTNSPSPQPAASAANQLPSPPPEVLLSRFPTLFNLAADYVPKTLITTSLNSTLHLPAQHLVALFPYSVYIPRSASSHAHKFSIREISRFASKRHYTSVVILEEDQKKPKGLTVVHLPEGPTFHFSMTNWVQGNKLPGHGRPTNHIPELIVNNFKTPLGLVTSVLFRTLFPAKPEIQGRQAVTLHNQRDYIFVRRHRYVFREKRQTEKPLIGKDGKEMEGGVRAGLQELGPRFTLKLRRVDQGVGRVDKGVEWEWKGRKEKVRTRFQL